MESPNALPTEERRGVYHAIYGRRDIRHFRPDPIPAAVLARLLDAAHHAGSVGFMQPWNFVLLSDVARRRQVKALFLAEREQAAQTFDEPHRSQYLSYKLEGILEAPLNFCVTCDTTRGGVVLGRSSIPETDVYSTCLAVENFWLAARAEGIGVGWVSILCNEGLRALFGIPKHVLPIAYLCVGYPTEFPEQPMLETTGWRQRLPLAETVCYERWAGQADDGWEALRACLARPLDEHLAGTLPAATQYTVRNVPSV